MLNFLQAFYYVALALNLSNAHIWPSATPVRYFKKIWFPLGSMLVVTKEAWQRAQDWFDRSKKSCGYFVLKGLWYICTDNIANFWNYVQIRPSNIKPFDNMG